MAIKAVALDAMGVIYTAGDDLRSILIPFLHENGCTLTEEEIAVEYRKCYRNGEPAATLWAAMACTGDVATLEESFHVLYELTPGVIDFLKAMQAAQIPVFMLSNDVKEWSIARRKLHQLDSYFAGFLVSGELGMYKPNPDIYAAMIEMLPCPPQDCIFVDDRPANLRAGVEAGLQPLQFALESDGEYPAVANFVELTRTVLQPA